MKSVNRYSFLAACSVALLVASLAVAQDTNTGGQMNQTRTVSNGQRVKIRGVVVSRGPESFTLRDSNRVDTVVRLTDRTSVRTNGGFLRSGRTYPVTNIIRGLNLEAEGRGDATGQLVAERVRFSESDLRVAQSIESRVDPVETRVDQAEQNAQRLSGQLDELAAVSNAARGGARAAQETADAAVAGVNATNDRISALDDYEARNATSVNFRVNSAVLSPESRAQLDQVAQAAQTARGYMIEVRGFADATGSTDRNRALSQRRADAVVRYLAETHNIPLRRIITPFGYGEAQPVADNSSREGRAQNRRVEVKLLVSRGLTQPAPTVNTPNSTGASTTSPE